MKTLIVMATLALLAGCGSMRTQSSGTTDSSSTSAYGTDATQQDRIFNSWVN